MYHISVKPGDVICDGVIFLLERCPVSCVQVEDLLYSVTYFGDTYVRTLKHTCTNTHVRKHALTHAHMMFTMQMQTSLYFLKIL